MDTIGLAVYIFIFPVIAAIVLGVIWAATYRDFRRSRRKHDEMV